MPTKLDTYTRMADTATHSLTAQIRDWSRFLIFAGRFYKYNFMDQVMIYTQRPDATACAEFDLWSVHMDRRIRRGSKGIALLYRTSGGRISYRYVYDVSDTERRRETSRDPRPWIYRPEYEGTVSAHLEACFKIPGNNGLANQLICLMSLTFCMASSALDLLSRPPADNAGTKFLHKGRVKFTIVLHHRLQRQKSELSSKAATFAAESFRCRIVSRHFAMVASSNILEPRLHKKSSWACSAWMMLPSFAFCCNALFASSIALLNE